ncbi:MAG: glutathione S-transferase family protein [Oleiphilus sp.]
MGLLQNGQWVDQWYDTKATDGKFTRQASRFRDWVSTEEGARFPPESGRYHLYVSLACPWAHRTLIFRALKDLEQHIDVTVVEPLMLENGWELKDDPYDLDFLYQLYLKADADYEGRVTVPVLWDKKTETIVSNESADIIRMLNSAFNELTGNHDDYYPETKRKEIEALNDRIYHTVNNGVYRAGFATKQAAYEQAFLELFDSLNWLEGILTKQTYLCGDRLTEADWRLFTTLIRFDAVYVGHFKCNHKRIADYPALSAYLKRLYQVNGVADTVNFEHIKQHYYGSHKTINPTGIIPTGPELDFN